MVDPYSPGGKHWKSVDRITQTCGCDQSLAIAALRVCDNVEEVAIASLSDPWYQLLPASSSSRRRVDPSSPAEDGNNINTPSDSEADDAPEVVTKSTRKQPYQSLPSRPTDGLQLVQPLSPKPDQAELEVESTDDTQADTRVGTSQEFILPILKLAGPIQRFTSEEGVTRHFSIERLTWALQNNLSHSDLLDYFSYFVTEAIAREINKEVEGIPAVFYAVATNDEKIVRSWIEHGGDVNAIELKSRIPLLAFAILQENSIQADTTTVVTTLLGLGADTSVIPKAFYSPFSRDLPASGPDAVELTDIEDENKRWCTESIRSKLTTAINLSQRYFLEKYLNRPQPSVRFREAAAKLNATSLFTLHFLMIGQSIALKMLVERLLSYLILPSSKPLVLFFAGPSGHGKSELGKHLGNLLSLKIQRIDMTGMRYETDLFGPSAPYVGCEKGSLLNNFLARMSGKRAIVFLDEFERSTTEVLNSLLIPFDEGRCTDRRTGESIDCSKIIWILASNALDSIITNFANSNDVCGLRDDNKMAASISDLQLQLIKGVKAKFGFPLAGRIPVVIPFLPFSTDEQVVIVHKYLLRLAQDIRGPVSLPKRLIGNVILRMHRDATLCKALAEGGYDIDMGARSLEAVVKSKVEGLLVQRYLESNSSLDENQRMEEYLVDVDKAGQIVIFRNYEQCNEHDA